MRHRRVIVIFIAALITVAAAEYFMGRSVFGPDGRFGWWDGDIWSSENSQRVADAYSFSHMGHGMLSYGLLFLVARKLPLHQRFLISVGIECAWEILENSPLIINRYREATISIGYVGDSILNSVCDVVFMSLGFLIARVARVPVTVCAFLAMEIGCLFWVRDNLTLNVIMLLHPVDAIKTWQAARHHGGG
jgi:hypothetical protein